MCSIDSCRSSVRQKSVANSSYQKRRLADESLNMDDRQEEETKQVNSIEAEDFFVDDVPIRVEIDNVESVLSPAEVENNNSDTNKVQFNKNNAFVGTPKNI